MKFDPANMPSDEEFAAMSLPEQDKKLVQLFGESHREAADRLEKLSAQPSAWLFENFGFAQRTMLKAASDLRQSQAALEYLVTRLHADGK